MLGKPWLGLTHLHSLGLGLTHLTASLYSYQSHRFQVDVTNLCFENMLRVWSGSWGDGSGERRGKMVITVLQYQGLGVATIRLVGAEV